MIRGALGILAAAVLFCPIACWLLTHVSVTPERVAQSARQFVQPECCLPEPGERSAFLAGVICLPALIFLFRFVSQRWRIASPTRYGQVGLWAVEAFVGAA